AVRFVLERADPPLKDLPPRERTRLTKEEKARLERARRAIRDYEEEIKPALAALTVSKFDTTTVPEALANAACDSDLEVRLGVRRTFAEMARASRFLRELRDLVPPAREDKEPEKLDLPREEDKKDGGKDKGKDGKDDLSRLPSSSNVVQVSDQSTEEL